MGKIILPALFAVLLCSACGKTPSVPEEPPHKPEANTTEQVLETEEPQQNPGNSTEEPIVLETKDHVLLTLEAPLTDGRTLLLEAVGRVLDEYSCGVREVRVYDGDSLLQTISVREVIEAEWGDGLADSFYDYTECWSPEKSMEVLDLNFDQNMDFGLFAWPPNNTIPYYYWQWDGEQYQYACTLQGAEVHPETGEVSSTYKGGWGGAHYQTDYYQPDGEGNLYLVRQEREYLDIPNLDYDYGSAIETWIPREGTVIRPRPAEQNEDDLILIRREIPVYEIQADNTVSYFMELWELKDGQLLLTSREEYDKN